MLPVLLEEGAAATLPAIYRAGTAAEEAVEGFGPSVSRYWQRIKSMFGGSAKKLAAKAAAFANPKMWMDAVKAALMSAKIPMSKLIDFATRLGVRNAKDLPPPTLKGRIWQMVSGNKMLVSVMAYELLQDASNYEDIIAYSHAHIPGAQEAVLNHLSAMDRETTSQPGSQDDDQLAAEEPRTYVAPAGIIDDAQRGMAVEFATMQPTFAAIKRLSGALGGLERVRDLMTVISAPAGSIETFEQLRLMKGVL